MNGSTRLLQHRRSGEGRRCRLSIALLGALCAALVSCSDAGKAPADLAQEAFVWGSPLVVSARTRQSLGALVGVNRLLNQTALSNASSRLVVAPNQDTLYSVAVLDLRREPMVLTVPDVANRYWTYQFLDAWTNSFYYIGTRGSAGRGGSFVITSPGWRGTLPEGALEVASPTPQLFLLGRFLVRDADDIANVVALERTLVPLHTVTGGAVPPPLPDLGAPAGTPQDVGGNGAAFFDELGDALSMNPPASDADRAQLERFAVLGIGPDLHPAERAREVADAATLDVLESSVSRGKQQIQDARDNGAAAVNGWTARLDIGTYGEDTLLRAVIARFGWGANVAAEAVYPSSQTDASGQRYTGARRYVMHFDAGRLPPVDRQSGFWSLTLYGPDQFFVENPIRRYAIGDRTQGLAYNADGSLDLYLQNERPQGRESNWLPAPVGEFVLTLRLYLPQQAVLDGRYEYPAVVPGS